MVTTRLPTGETPMRIMRRLAKNVICVDFWLNLSWEAGLCLIGLIGAAVFVLVGEYNRALDLGGRVLAGVGCLAFVWWVAKDAKRHADRIRNKKKAESTGQNPRQHGTGSE